MTLKHTNAFVAAFFLLFALLFSGNVQAQTLAESIRGTGKAAPARSGPAFPALTGRVVDQANILTPAAEQDLSLKLQGLEEATSDQLVIVTVNSLEGYQIEEYGYQLGRHWGIGQDGTRANAQGNKLKDNGVLLIVAPNERSVRIEVGYGLEPVLTDAMSGLIIREGILPAFRNGDYEGGVVAGTDLIIEQLSLDRGVAIQKAQAATQQAAQASDGPPAWMIILIFIFIALFSRGWLPFFLLGSLGGGGFRGGGGGGFGGGFGGGGGGFGGGGASGSW